MIAAISLALSLLAINSSSTVLTIPTPALASYEDAQLTAGRKAYDAGNYHEAVTILKDYLEKKPKSFEGQYYLGLSYQELKQYNEAVATLKRAVVLKPKVVQAHYELGQTYLAIKNYEAAVREYKWLQQQKNDPWVADDLRPYIPEEVAKQYQLPPSPLEQQRVALAAAHPIVPMTNELRPAITYKEKASYTNSARDHKVQGTVVINLVFSREGKTIVFGVVRGLPYGLTESAIRAAQKIRFTPVIKEGKPISVRGNVEFNFTLY